MHTSPPFLGCCRVNPCVLGECPDDKLGAAVVSGNQTLAELFLNLGEEGGGGGLGTGTGAVVGVIVGGVVLLVGVVLGVMWRMGWFTSRSKRALPDDNTPSPSGSSPGSLQRE